MTSCAHACCTPIVIQVPGLQGTGVVWENCTEAEKKDITDRIFDPIREETTDKLNKTTAKADEAKRSAEAAAVSESNAKETEATVKNIQSTFSSVVNSSINEITQEGTKQVNKVIAEGNLQIKRIHLEVDDAVVAQGTGCSERFWVLSNNVVANTNIEIPNGAHYVVGRHHLRVSWNGIVLAINRNFVEVGTVDTFSNLIQLTFDAKAGDELDIWIGALGKGDVAEAIALASEASAAVADLSRKVVYKEKV